MDIVRAECDRAYRAGFIYQRCRAQRTIWNVATSNALSAIAVLISLVAVAFSGLQWWESHNQLLLSMKPSVDFETLDDTEDFPVGISIRNSGPGPATIKSITYYAYYADKKEVGDVDKVLDYANLENIPVYELEEGDTLAVGEQHLLLGYMTKPRHKDEEKQLGKLVDFIDHHLAVDVQFCPAVSGECYTKCSTKGWCK